VELSVGGSTLLDTSRPRTGSREVLQENEERQRGDEMSHLQWKLDGMTDGRKLRQKRLREKDILNVRGDG
jgi:hypothetical protein